MKNKKYALYIHHVLKEDLFYVGITANINRRFVNYRYERTSLSDYLDKTIPFKQNKNIETVCTEPLYTYEEAKFVEDWFITAFKPGKCINKQRSNLVWSNNPKEYKRKWSKEHSHDPKRIEQIMEWQKNHKDKMNEATKRWQSTPGGKIYTRVQKYNRYHQPVETPLEAKQRYLSEGYIPNYIKHDDIPYAE